MRRTDPSYVVDADVLIDYCESDLQMLSQFSQYIGTVNIARSTLERVEQLTEAAAKKHNLEIQTPDMETIIAASARRGSLAYDDHETLLLAKCHDWTCITNDKALRRACGAEGIDCLWGLEPMKMLVQRRLVRPSDVIAVARKIRLSNPLYITETIVSRFEEEIRSVSRHHGKGN